MEPPVHPPLPGLSQLVSCPPPPPVPRSQRGIPPHAVIVLLISFSLFTSWLLGVILGLYAIALIVAAAIFIRRQKKRKARLSPRVFVLSDSLTK